MSCLVWVLGAGGLLGREVLRALRARAAIFAPPSPLRWADASTIASQIVDSLAQFVTASRAFDEWRIVWCAGVGTVGTPLAALEMETATLRRLVSSIAESELSSRRGAVFLASSAGGVYGDSPDRPLSEASRIAPLSDYGRNKVVQESLVAEILAPAKIPFLIGRISNLYGPGQNLAKPQGFVSQLLRSVLLRRTINVYVPLDTRRDFLFAADCAAHIVACLDVMPDRESATKVFANGQSATMHQVIAIAGRIARQRPHVVFQPSLMAKQQPQAHWYTSHVLADIALPQRTPLQVGMKAVLEALRAQHQLGAVSVSARAG